MAGAFDGSRYTALVFQAVARDTARQQFALLIDELEQKVRVLVINVFDAELAEAAVFFVFQPDFRIAEKLNVFSRSSHIVGVCLCVNECVNLDAETDLFDFGGDFGRLNVEIYHRGR